MKMNMFMKNKFFQATVHEILASVFPEKAAKRGRPPKKDPITPAEVPLEVDEEDTKVEEGELLSSGTESSEGSSSEGDSLSSSSRYN